MQLERLRNRNIAMKGKFRLGRSEVAPQSGLIKLINCIRVEFFPKNLEDAVILGTGTGDDMLDNYSNGNIYFFGAIP